MQEMTRPGRPRQTSASHRENICPVGGQISALPRCLMAKRHRRKVQLVIRCLIIDDTEAFMLLWLSNWVWNGVQATQWSESRSAATGRA